MIKLARRSHPGILALTLLSISFLVAACGILPLLPTATNSPVFSKQARITISLSHRPTGTADLRWDSASHTLTVSLAIIGLAPKSAHVVHIHAGKCAAMGQVVYALHPLVADEHGIASSTTTLDHMMTSIPSNRWAINIHNGSTLVTPLEARPIACGNITSVWATLGAQSAHVQLSSTISPDGAVHGMAQLRLLADHTLIVTLSLNGLAPATTHLAHIHAGSCVEQGPVVYDLQPIVADAVGNAMTISVITLHSPFPDHWYITIHEAGSTAAMQTSQGLNPIACGDIG